MVQAVKRQSRSKGAQGEQRAAAWLVEHGWTIRERNFRTRRAEIDIIAQKGELLVFFEVKAWGSLPQTELEYSLSARKRGRIAQAAMSYLARNSFLSSSSLRFDVIFIGQAGIQHIEGAFPGGVD